MFCFHLEAVVIFQRAFCQEGSVGKETGRWTERQKNTPGDVRLLVKWYGRSERKWEWYMVSLVSASQRSEGCKRDEVHRWSQRVLRQQRTEEQSLNWHLYLSARQLTVICSPGSRAWGGPWDRRPRDDLNAPSVSHPN